jgi:hypothetical protein
MARDARARHVFRDLPEEFVAGTMRALAETTMEFMTANPKMADQYRQLGFAVLWAGITKKK